MSDHDRTHEAIRLFREATERAEAAQPPITDIWEDEHGCVWLEREDGSIAAFMHRSDFDSFGFGHTPRRQDLADASPRVHVLIGWPECLEEP